MLDETMIKHIKHKKHVISANIGSASHWYIFQLALPNAKKKYINPNPNTDVNIAVAIDINKFFTSIFFYVNKQQYYIIFYLETN